MDAFTEDTAEQGRLIPPYGTSADRWPEGAVVRGHYRAAYGAADLDQAGQWWGVQRPERVRMDAGGWESGPCLDELPDTWPPE